MASRGSALSRAIRFFEEGDLREVKVAFHIVHEIVETRLKDAGAKVPVRTLKARKPRQQAAPVAASAGTGESLARA